MFIFSLQQFPVDAGTLTPTEPFLACSSAAEQEPPITLTFLDLQYHFGILAVELLGGNSLWSL